MLPPFRCKIGALTNVVIKNVENRTETGVYMLVSPLIGHRVVGAMCLPIIKSCKLMLSFDDHMCRYSHSNFGNLKQECSYLFV